MTAVLWFSWDTIFYEPKICFLDDLREGDPELIFACTNEKDVSLAPESIDQQQLVQYAFELINADREKYGAPELVLINMVLHKNTPMSFFLLVYLVTGALME